MKQKALAQLLFLFFATALSIFALVVMFSSCDTAKQSQKGYDKFIKYGGKFECKNDTIVKTISIKGKDGKDSLIYLNVPCNCPDVELPETRYETRWKYKYLIKDSKQDTKRAKIEGNTQIKLSKQVTERTEEQTKQIKQHTKGIIKTAFPWEWLFVLCISIVILIFLKWKR